MGALDFRLLCSSFSNEGQSSILPETVAYNQANQMLPDVGIDGEVCIQRALKLTNVDLGMNTG